MEKIFVRPTGLIDQFKISYSPKNPKESEMIRQKIEVFLNRKPVKKFDKDHTVIKAKEGVITKIKRGRDGLILQVGQKTKTGEILSFKSDTSYASNMYAECKFGDKVTNTAVSCIAE